MNSQPDITIFSCTASVNAVLKPKASYFPDMLEYFGLTPDQVGYIGDEVVDSGVLASQHLGLAGVPANGQEKVIDQVGRQPNGYLLQQAGFAAFREFYREAEQRGLELVVSDKHGILAVEDDAHYGPQFRELLETAGCKGKPQIAVLSGSSLRQNASFIMEYLRLENHNPAIKRRPGILFLEGGAIQYNPLTGETMSFGTQEINPEVLETLKGQFEFEVLRKIAFDVVPKLGPSWDITVWPEYQQGRIWWIDKKTMTTFNLPRYTREGRPFRNSCEAVQLREIYVGAMARAAKSVGFSYQIV
jgi:hypothetical protein